MVKHFLEIITLNTKFYDNFQCNKIEFKEESLIFHFHSFFLFYKESESFKFADFICNKSVICY